MPNYFKIITRFYYLNSVNFGINQVLVNLNFSKNFSILAVFKNFHYFNLYLQASIIFDCNSYLFS